MIKSLITGIKQKADFVVGKVCPKYRIHRDLCSLCSTLYTKGLISCTDGNLSTRLDDQKILITPKFQNKSKLQPSDLVEYNLHDKTRPKNVTSEASLHTLAYLRRKDISYVLHTHPLYTTTMSISHPELIGRPYFPTSVLLLGKVPIVPYYPPGSEELARACADALADSNVAILKGHGAVVVGKSILQIQTRTEHLEWNSRAIYLMKNANSPTLTEEEVKQLESRSRSLGVLDGAWGWKKHDFIK
ncbi:3-oxo-tetronate 4-phosphate decarboxylase-related [Anaeramoeba flamelloides]|uniref:3-oxo-tetronate 4-phosphate decarboxylase-related n=1 Tax=Anaeramoeba flamelloides TaxID=1746091 RepID=A0ABQ8Y1H9_9EUKA|nr:3-oxo-tetronate 4-phosphate decarboxylase-related [Anaeramoeba flamelloides]